jgi:hypothetical protein
MISVETVPGIRAGGMKESSGDGEFKYDILLYWIHSKNLWKCYNIPPPSTTIIKKDPNDTCLFQQ